VPLGTGNDARIFLEIAIGRKRHPQGVDILDSSIHDGITPDRLKQGVKFTVAQLC
jgi:hypothetical protein